MDEAWREKVRERASAIWLRQGSPDGQAEQFWLMAEEELLAERPSRVSVPVDEATVDEVIDGSFPGSDPPAWSSKTGAGAPANAPQGRTGQATK